MATIVVFNIPATGHINPTVPVVAELVRRGERVIYYATEAYRAKIEGAGAEFRTYDLATDFTPGPGVAGPLSAMVQIIHAAEAIIPRVIDQLRADRPDVIIYDSMCVWGKQLAQMLRVPAICSCSIFVACSKNARALPGNFELLPQILAMSPQLIGWLRQFRASANRLKQRYGVDTPGLLDFFANPGEMTLTYSSRYFQAGADLLGESFKFVGPSIAPRGDDGDFPIEWLTGAPVIYISLGTLMNDRPEFYRACFAAFKDSPYRVVLSLGRRVDRSHLGDVPANFLVREHVPQLNVLQHAALFITHGGMNSTVESAWFGVPMLVVPQMGDQLFVAGRIEQLGAGVRMKPAQATAAGLRTQADRVVSDDRFRAASTQIGESLRAAGGFAAAADEVQMFVRMKT